MAIALRSYRRKDVERLRDLHRQGHRRVCYVAPTGSGKTVLFVHLAGLAFAKGFRVAIVDAGWRPEAFKP
jgi:superfamily II DNA or RNA helicase